MPSFQDQLARAHADIDLVQRRIEDQSALIERLQQDGYDTGQAEHLMATFLELLTKLTVHLETLERQGPDERRQHSEAG